MLSELFNTVFSCENKQKKKKKNSDKKSRTLLMRNSILNIATHFIMVLKRLSFYFLISQKLSSSYHCEIMEFEMASHSHVCEVSTKSR